jgi:hypothetical protein
MATPFKSIMRSNTAYAYSNRFSLPRLRSHGSVASEIPARAALNQPFAARHGVLAANGSRHNTMRAAYPDIVSNAE